MNYCEFENSYIDDVLAGRIVACKWTKAACQRQREDLEKQSRDDWPYIFEPEAGNTICDFLQLLPHIKGDKGGQLLKLEPWQVFCITTAFGWKRKDKPRLRRFRRFFLECGKSNGKSFLSSGIALYMLCADEEPGAECVAAARATDQARLVFDCARDMCRARPQLCEMFGIRVLQHSIVVKSTASTFKPVSAQGKSLAGMLLHYASVDELEFHRDRQVIDEMTLGCDKRSNSLLSTIQHAGSDLASPGYEAHTTATKILSGELRDERSFCVIYSAEGFDWKSDDAIRAANPNLNVSVYFDQLREQRDRAIAIPAQQEAYRSHNLAEWVSGNTAWIEVEKIVACRQRGLQMSDFRCWKIGEHSGVTRPDMPRPFAIGLDLASKQDLAAAIFLTIGFVDGVEHFYAFGRYYLPSETISKSAISQYKGWAQRNLLVTHTGPANDYAAIEADVLNLYRRSVGFGAMKNRDGYNFVGCAYDSWQAQQMTGNFEKAGMAVVPFSKTAKVYSPVMDDLAALILASRFHFSADDEILRWCLSNVHCHLDANNNRFPRKADDDQNRKIDAAIALMYAFRLAQTGLLAAPEAGNVRVTFLSDDGKLEEVRDGKMVEIKPPIFDEHGKRIEEKQCH